jgi:hypothetical protein
MNKETKKAAQDAYLEARSVGHTKEEARSIRDNWKPSKSKTYNISDDDDDEMTQLNQNQQRSLRQQHG